jgi:Fic family protein
MTPIDHTPSHTPGRLHFARPLLKFLLTKTEERYARLNAFCYLMDHAAPQPGIVSLHKTQLSLDTGQQVTTVSELARIWKWQRSTVRTFLSGLVALGCISLESFGKYRIITMMEI